MTKEERAERICGKCKHRKLDLFAGNVRKVYRCDHDFNGYRVGKNAHCHQQSKFAYEALED